VSAEHTWVKADGTPSNLAEHTRLYSPVVVTR